MTDALAVGRILHVKRMEAPGKCFAAIVTSVFEGGFTAEVFFPPGFRLTWTREYTGKPSDEGIYWHWPMDKDWHGT